MKRVFIIDEHISSKQNGVGTYMSCLLECMNDLDVEVNLMSFNSDEKFFSIYEDKGYRFYNYPVCNGGNMLGGGGLFWPILKMYVEDSADNVFFVNHSPCVDFMKSLREQYRKSRIIFTIHDQGWTASLLGDKERLRDVVSKSYPRKKQYDTERFCKKYFVQERKMYRMADDVVCLSETTRQLLCHTYKVPAGKIHLIPNGFPDTDGQCAFEKREQIRKRLGIAKGERVLLFVGRTVKAKGIEELLQAFDNLCARYENLRLVIAGEVFTFNEFAKLTPKSATRITYTGLIPKERLRQWYKAANIGVLPSYTEQCSYTGMEMMANNLLVVTTDGNGLTDMFRPEHAVVAHIKPHFAESLEQAIETALHLSEDARRSLCLKAKNYLRMHYALSIMKEGYHKLLSQ